MGGEGVRGRKGGGEGGEGRGKRRGEGRDVRGEGVKNKTYPSKLQICICRPGKW